MRGLTQAVEGFFSGFGLPVYGENAVPVGAALPYLTVQAVEPVWDAAVPFHARIWFRSLSDAPGMAVADAIGAAIGPGGAYVPFEGGCAWIYKGRVFAQRMPMERDPGLRCIVLSLVMQAIGE